MDLYTYLETKEKNASFARRLGAPPSLVSQWKNGDRPVAKKWRRKIESITGGLVTVRELSPELRELLSDLGLDKSNSAAT